jgi:hypothetical protein
MLNDLAVFLGYFMTIVWAGYVIADLVGLTEFVARFLPAPRPIQVRCGCGRQSPVDGQLAGRFGRCGHSQASIAVTERRQWSSAA